MTDVTVVGCGVVGLSTAVLLRERGFDARILAAAMPPETVSSVAAAIWYPYKAYPEDRVLAWGARAFRVFRELAEDERTGIIMREGLELFGEPAAEPWWAPAVPGVRRCEPEELPQGRAAGYAFTVPVVEMPVYLGYLLDRFTGSGGTVERRNLGSLEEVEDSRAIVDCAGLGARKLVNDRATRPIRGQVVRVRNPGLERFLLDDDNPEGVTYIVPRSEDCILGGTAEEDEWDTTPDPEVARGILKRCAALEPRLAEAEVLEHKVGLRPGRPEVRLELEVLENGMPCVHNYGHGGSGVTLSWGCAEETVSLVERALAR